MSKMKAIIFYLFMQTRYEMVIFWSINATIVAIACLLASIFSSETFSTAITPSIPIFVLVGVIGAKWINRTLSYMLRLGINRLQYAVGSIVFMFLYNAISSIGVIMSYGLYKLIVNSKIVLEKKFYFLHPSQLFTSEPNMWHIFITDALLLSLTMIIFMLYSVAFHRLGKLGGYLILGITGVIFIISASFGWLNPIFEFISQANFLTITILILLLLILLAALFTISLKKVSIICAQN